MKRLLGILCLILSFILLFTNFAVFKAAVAVDLSDYREEVRNLFSGISSAAAMFGVNVDTGKINNISQCLLDGKLSPHEVLKVAFNFMPIIRKINTSYSGLLQYTGINLKGIKTVLSLYIFLYVLNLILFILSLVLLRNPKHKTFLTAYMVSSLILTLSLSIAILSSADDLHLHLTVSPFLTAAFSVAAFILLKSPEAEAEKISTKFVSDAVSRVKKTWEDMRIAHRANKEKLRENTDIQEKETGNRFKETTEKRSWQCSNCGQSNALKDNFCANCGRPKPEIFSPSEALPKTEPVKKEEPRKEQPHPESVSQVEIRKRSESAKRSGLRRCAFCGSIMDDSQKYCMYCGKPAGSVKESKQQTFRYCLNCGSKLPFEVGYCLYCGASTQGKSAPGKSRENDETIASPRSKKKSSPLLIILLVLALLVIFIDGYALFIKFR